jgi:hypothetical protein
MKKCFKIIQIIKKIHPNLCGHTITNDNELHVFNCMWLQIDWMNKRTIFLLVKVQREREGE